jgi:hypothetical protein
MTRAQFDAQMEALHAEGHFLYARYREARKVLDNEQSDLLRYLLRQNNEEWRALMSITPVEASER